MATETQSSMSTQINPKMSLQSNFVLGEARRLYDKRAGQEIPSLYTGISDERQESLDQILALARGGTDNSINDAAVNEYKKTLSGGYMNANPYIDEIVQRAAGAAGSSAASGMVGQGRFGSGVMANAMADSMQSTAANIYGQNYQQERDRMMSMLGQRGDIDQGLEQAKYRDANRIGDVGRAYEEDEMRLAAEQMRQYQAEQEHLNTFLQQLGMNPLMGETIQSGKTTTLDYGAMAAGGAQALGGLA